MKDKLRLTDVEHELMTILWELGEGSVNDVIAKLPAERNLAYTSVSTILRILKQKEVVSTREEKRKHIYIPQISKDEFQQSAVNNLVDNIFKGDTSNVVTRLLGNSNIAADDIDAIKKLLDEKSGKKHD